MNKTAVSDTSAYFALLRDYFSCLQWFDTLGWASGRASGL